MLVELEGSRILHHHLPDTLQKLCEDWGDITTLACKMATPGKERGRGGRRGGEEGIEREREKDLKEGEVHVHLQVTVTRSQQVVLP